MISHMQETEKCTTLARSSNARWTPNLVHEEQQFNPERINILDISFFSPYSSPSLLPQVFFLQTKIVNNSSHTKKVEKDPHKLVATQVYAHFRGYMRYM